MRRTYIRRYPLHFSALLVIVLLACGSVDAQNVATQVSSAQETAPNTDPAGGPQGQQPKIDLSKPYKNPPGAAGRSTVQVQDKSEPSPGREPVVDRWRIGHPDWDRTVKGRLLNPYRQNVLKGDYPIFGNHTFLILTGESETFTRGRRIPVPSDVSTARPNSEEFFGRGEQLNFNQNFILSADLFHGDTSFKPADWRVKFTPVFNINYVLARENGIINLDPRRGTSRTDGHVGLQEGFLEIRLGDTPKLLPFLRNRGSRGGHSPYFDSTSVRVGIQQFNSDFRGLIFNDNNLGARIFGNYDNNKWQFNLAYFYMLEKNTNSGLNTLDARHQRVAIANLYRQDFIKPGYTTQFSFHYNDDQPSLKFDDNRFLVRPAFIGDIRTTNVKVGYFGWTGDGHFRRININHAFYQAIGQDSRNPIAGKYQRINGQLAALELSIDRDWQRFKGSFFFTSGDGNPRDGVARGFDSILDSQFFAGGDNSFWNSNEIRLTQTGVALTTQNSLIPSLRSSKIQGQANFVNPGIMVFNAGYDALLTPKLKLFLNFNYLRFHKTESLEYILFQPNIRNNIGLDYGAGVVYRPLLSENMVIKAGANFMNPLGGFKDIYTSNCDGAGCGRGSQFLYSFYSKVIFTF